MTGHVTRDLTENSPKNVASLIQAADKFERTVTPHKDFQLCVWDRYINVLSLSPPLSVSVKFVTQV